MIIKFKKQEYQTKAVNSIIKCFEGQRKLENVNFIIDPGETNLNEINELEYSSDGIRNADIELSQEEVLLNINKVQALDGNLRKSKKLEKSSISDINLEVEMETGTGKTYVYIKTMFELNKKYGWSKFIIVVPSIAIREGVYEAFNLTNKHFRQEYNKQIRAFIYNSKSLLQIKNL